MKKPDVRVQYEGTLVLLHLLTDASREWVEEHVSEDRQMWGDAVAVEPRFVTDLIAGMQADGLEVA